MRILTHRARHGYCNKLRTLVNNHGPFFYLEQQLQPIADFEDSKGDKRDNRHDGEVDPKAELIIKKWYGGVHRHHVGIGGEREEDGREDGEHLHGLIELVREERVVGVFERFNSLLLTFEEVPETDVGTDEVLIVDGELVWNMRMITLDEGFDDSTLGLQGSAEIQDIALQDRDFEHHLFFFA